MEDDNGGRSPIIDLELSAKLDFHGAGYLITAKVLRPPDDDEFLAIEVEQEFTDDRWCGRFSRKYIEDITTKTGNYKKFQVFVKMVATALQQTSESVVMDLLTYADLEMLKARKMGQDRDISNNTSVHGSKCTNKRYLILTYAVEFDRVHYPLALTKEDNPPPDVLKGTIRRLKQELQSLRTLNMPELHSRSSVPPFPHEGGSYPYQPVAARALASTEQDVTKLHKENAELRSALRKQVDEVVKLQRRREDPPQIIQRLKNDNKGLREEVEELQEAIQDIKRTNGEEIHRLKRQMMNSPSRTSSSPSSQRGTSKTRGGAGALTEKENIFRKKINDLENQLSKERLLIRRLQAKHKREMSELVKQLEKEVQTSRALRSRNRELTRELSVVVSNNNTPRRASLRTPSPASSRNRSRPTSRRSPAWNSGSNKGRSSGYASGGSERGGYNSAGSAGVSGISSSGSTAPNSRASSRESSPRMRMRTGKDKELSTSTKTGGKVPLHYGDYDERGVNVRRARGEEKVTSKRSSYVSPYAQNSGYASSPSHGYLSSDSRLSNGSKRSQQTTRSQRTSVSKQSNGASSAQGNGGRRVSPANRKEPVAVGREEGRGGLNLAACLTTRSIESCDESPRDRSKAGGVPVRQSNGKGGEWHENTPPSTVWENGFAWEHEGTESHARSLPVNTVQLNTSKSKLQDEKTASLSPYTAKEVRKVEGVKGGVEVSFDATNEIGEIDRRLSALQTFLKQAKNGIIGRIPNE